MDARGGGKKRADKVDSDALSSAGTGRFSFPGTPPPRLQAPAPGARSPSASATLLARSADRLTERRGAFSSGNFRTVRGLDFSLSDKDAAAADKQRSSSAGRTWHRVPRLRTAGADKHGKIVFHDTGGFFFPGGGGHAFRDGEEDKAFQGAAAAETPSEFKAESSATGGFCFNNHRSDRPPYHVDDLYSRSARLFAPSLCTALNGPPGPTMEDWLAASQSFSSFKVDKATRRSTRLLCNALAPQLDSHIRGWRPMGADTATDTGTDSDDDDDDDDAEVDPGGAVHEGNGEEKNLADQVPTMAGQGAIPYHSPPAASSSTPDHRGRAAVGLYARGSEMCVNWRSTGVCRYGDARQFAHGWNELRQVTHHPLHRTRLCRSIRAGVTCPYAHRCLFRHAIQPGDYM